MKNTTDKQVKAYCYAGNVETQIGSFNSVKEAKIFFGSKVQIDKSHFVPAIGFIKLRSLKKDTK